MATAKVQDLFSLRGLRANKGQPLQSNDCSHRIVKEFVLVLYLSHDGQEGKYVIMHRLG